MNDYRNVREWLISLLNDTAEPFTSEVDEAMQELWKRRESVFGERRAIVHVFEAVLSYRKEKRFFTPHYFEQQDRLNHLRREMIQRARALKEYVEKYVMDESGVLQVLGKVGAVIADSHIVYTSGKHGSAYVNKDAVYPHTAETSLLCRVIAERFADDNVEVVIAPAIGGNVVGLGVLCNRGGITPPDVADVPRITALVNVKLDAWDAAACPLCERNVPINTDVGHGRQFLDSRRQ